MEKQRLVQLAEMLCQLHSGYDRSVCWEIDSGLHDSACDNEVDVGAGLPEDGRNLLRTHSSDIDVTDLKEVVAAV